MCTYLYLNNLYLHHFEKGSMFTKLYWTLQNYTGHYKIILDPTKLHWTLQNYTGQLLLNYTSFHRNIWHFTSECSKAFNKKILGDSNLSESGRLFFQACACSWYLLHITKTVWSASSTGRVRLYCMNCIVMTVCSSRNVTVLFLSTS